MQIKAPRLESGALCCRIAFCTETAGHVISTSWRVPRDTEFLRADSARNWGLIKKYI